MKNQTLKPKVGFYGISGCAGCLLSVLFEEPFKQLNELLDIKSFPLIKEESYRGNFDITFIEGTVVFDKDIETIKKIRKKTKKVVALGSCACFGGVPSIKNFRDEKKVMEFVYPKFDHLNSRKPSALHEHIEVDYFLPQCPPNKNEILEFVKCIVIDKKFKNYRDPVCIECRKKENPCLLEKNELCLGPVANGGCNALCPSNSTGCYGCRGPCKDANYKAFLNILKEKGYTEKNIKDKMETFAGIEFEKEEKEKISTWLER